MLWDLFIVACGPKDCYEWKSLEPYGSRATCEGVMIDALNSELLDKEAKALLGPGFIRLAGGCFQESTETEIQPEAVIEVSKSGAISIYPIDRG